MTQQHPITQQSAPVRRPVGGTPRRTALPSGLRVVTEQVPGSQSCSIGFFVGVGSRHEPVPVQGAAHFLEHVLFKGTPQRSAEEISASIERVGGDMNAYTAKEQTCFYARVLADEADLAVDVLSDMLSHSLIAAPDVESERAVILDEIAMHNDDHAEMAQENLAWQLFGAEGLGLPIIGSEASIAELRPDQVAGYFHDHYRPADIVVSGAGRIDHDRLVDRLADFTGAAQGAASAVTTPTPTVAYAKGPMVLAEQRPLEQTSAVLGVRGVGQFDERRSALSLLSLVLGGGMSSRLFVEVRERRGLAYGIDAGETCYSDAGLWTVEWQSHPDRVADILELVRAQLFDIAERGIGADELARAKTQLRGQTVLGYESAAARMSRNGVGVLTGDDRSIDEMLARCDAVDGDELRDVASALFPVDPVLSLVGPPVGAAVERRIAHWA